jgi:hypothetical protein
MDAGIDRALIEGIECLSKKLWFIVFKERVQRQKYINKDIQLYLKVFTLKSTDVIRPERPRYTYVKVFGYPLDTKADLLEQSLSLYGKLIEVTDDIDTTIMIKTSRNTAKQARSVECVVTRVTVKVIAQRNDATFAKRKATNRVSAQSTLSISPV